MIFPVFLGVMLALFLYFSIIPFITKKGWWGKIFKTIGFLLFLVVLSISVLIFLEGKQYKVANSYSSSIVQEKVTNGSEDCEETERYDSKSNLCIPNRPDWTQEDIDNFNK